MYNDQPPPNRTAAQNKAHSKGKVKFSAFVSIFPLNLCKIMTHLTPLFYILTCSNCTKNVIKYLINVIFIHVFIEYIAKTSIVIFVFNRLGALAFDKKTGFWMISSIPRFPAKVSDGYHFSDQQKRFGQIVLCVTVPLSVKEDIGNDILQRGTKILCFTKTSSTETLFIFILIFSENIFSTTNPYIYDKKNFAVKGGNSTSESTTVLRTSKKNWLIVFAKSATFGKGVFFINKVK